MLSWIYLLEIFRAKSLIVCWSKKHVFVLVCFIDFGWLLLSMGLHPILLASAKNLCFNVFHEKYLYVWIRTCLKLLYLWRTLILSKPLFKKIDRFTFVLIDYKSLSIKLICLLAITLTNNIVLICINAFMLIFMELSLRKRFNLFYIWITRTL